MTDSSTRLTDALRLAGTLIRDKRDPEIDLFSDGAAGDLSEFENKGLRVMYHRLGQRCDNLGITTLDIRENPENHHERAIYTSVANFSTNARQTVLELLFDQAGRGHTPIDRATGGNFAAGFHRRAGARRHFHRAH